MSPREYIEAVAIIVLIISFIGYHGYGVQTLGIVGGVALFVAVLSFVIDAFRIPSENDTYSEGGE